jgi:hypothetical protein
LLHDAKLLIGVFPHLRASVDQDELPLNFIMARGSGAVTKKTRRRRRRMSAEREQESWRRRSAGRSKAGEEAVVDRSVAI